jgi:hypothetical protein
MSALDPYARVTSGHDTVSIERTLALSGANNQGLIFRTSLGKGEVAFAEVPIVIEPIYGNEEKHHEEHHNSRFAWSIAEEALKALSPEQIQAIIEARYATGGIAGTWESPGDDKALLYMTQTYKAEASAVRLLYDIMATNCVVADMGLSPFIGPGGARMYMSFPKYGFFLLLSRANHSCQPSVTINPPKKQSRAVPVITTRPVVAGEALTFDYMHMEPLKGKRLKLLKAYGFRCACDYCRTLCSWIECSNKASKSCSACHTVHYCCVEHQRADWPRHKANECVKK